MNVFCFLTIQDEDGKRPPLYYIKYYAHKNMFTVSPVFHIYNINKFEDLYNMRKMEKKLSANKCNLKINY